MPLRLKLHKRLAAAVCLMAASLLYGQQQPAAVLHVLAPVSGLRVWIDGREAGRTPLFGLMLPAGETVVTVAGADSLSWLTNRWERRVVLKAGLAAVLHAEVEQRIWISSEPPGTEVWIGSELLGRTPMAAPLHRLAGQTVCFEKDGYHTLRSIGPNRDSEAWHHQLVPEGQDLARSFKPPQFNRKKMLLGSTLALALGAAGYWCKYKAESAYDDYLETGNPKLMQKHFDRATRYDRFSSALYVAGESVLGFTVYISMKELWK